MASANRGVVFQQINRLYGDGTLSGLGDGQLLERYLTRGDEAAFEALVNLHGPMVLGLCRRMLRDPRDIEDAFQATFLILVRKASTIRDRLHLSNWLYGVAYRVARRARTNTLRRRGREVAVEDLEASAAPETADILGIGPVLDQELNRLPRKYSDPLILCYLKGHTHDQAAEELECPVGTVRSRLARGRDLLRRRLTSRGHAPTAAILGGEAGLSARLLTEAVPPSLVSATVETALGIGTSKTILAGASALALAQGVLTTMKLAQLKLIGLAVLAAGLTAGGVITVSYASAQALKGTQLAVARPVDGVDPLFVTRPQAKEKEPGERPAVDLTAQLEKEIEIKFDLFLKDIHYSASDGSLGGYAGDGTVSQKVFARKLAQMGFVPATRQLVAHTTASARAFPKQDDNSRKIADPQQRSIQEIAVELKMAMDNEAQTQQLFEQHVVSAGERELARGKVLLVKARIEGIDDDLADELAQLDLQIKKRKAEIDQADALMEVASSVVARNLRLNERKAGMVDELTVTKAEAELKAGFAQVRLKKVELEETELRVRQLERRRARIKQVIK